ncbi:MAG: mechanosensitive ion channel domain-containing protein [Acholeplasmataceae bacterium]
MSLAEQLRELLNNLFDKFIKIESLKSLLVSLIMITFWILLAYIITKLFKIILFKTKSLEEKLDKKETEEQKTIKRLINNVIRFFFIFWILVMILNELGLDLIPLLAGAGVLAFAVGFGAQELIKDVISGMFLIIEKTFKIGDNIEIGNTYGKVIDVGLRRIKLENWKGEIITINNGDIKTVKNLSINPSFAVIEFKTDYDFKLKELNSSDFKNLLTSFKKNNPDVIEMPKSVLLVDLNEGLKFSINIKTKNRTHVGIERAFRKDLINYFNDKNIKIKIPLLINQQEN